MTMKNIVIFIFLFWLSSNLSAECVIKNSDGGLTGIKNDRLYSALIQATPCPTNVLALKAILERNGLSMKPFMVANQGFHNVVDGSFSFFESASGAGVKDGDLLFGHFTTLNNGIVELDQTPRPRKLLIEAIAWDSNKGLYNFYELIGQKSGAQWFYRGDSADALADNTFLYRTVPEGQTQFGKRMRCSACHNSGGPIMKELLYPHNDWWTSVRRLSLLPNRPSQEVRRYLDQVMDASALSQTVQSGIARLEASPAYQAKKRAISLEEQLRPLFCETEINLLSDPEIFEMSLAYIHIPSASLINPFLYNKDLKVSYERYELMLKKYGMHFPNTNRLDADHAWLVPVKGYSDHQAVESMIINGIIDEDFAAKVYAIDMKTPLLSAQRCGLLKLLPEKEEGWQQAFINNLHASPQPEAHELAMLLSDKAVTRSELAKRAENYLEELTHVIEGSEGFEQIFEQLLSSRARVATSEISQNPRGQILEPGFRVIFPEFSPAAL